MGDGGNLLLVFAGFQAPAFSTTLRFAVFRVRRRCGSDPPRASVAQGDRTIQVLVNGDGAARQGVPNRLLSSCHDRAAIATVLSFATTRSVWIVNTQSKSVRLQRRKAVPFSCAATVNFVLNSAI